MIDTRTLLRLPAGAVLAVAIPMITACGGGGGGSSSGSTPSDATTAVETLLFYTEEDGGGTVSLHAVDPRDPGSPALVDDALAGIADYGNQGSQVAAVTAGMYDAGTLQGAHRAWVVYASSDGYLYRVSTEPGEQAGDIPSPVQISDESGASTICDMEIITDYARALDSVLLYDLPGSDCTSTTTHLVRLDDGDSESPVEYDRSTVHSQTLDPATGALSELVFVSGSIVEHFDLDQNQWDPDTHDLNGTSTSYTPGFVDDHTGRMLLVSGQGDEMFVYEPAARTSEPVTMGSDVPNPFYVDDAIGPAGWIAVVEESIDSDPGLYALDLAAESLELVRLSTGSGSYTPQIVSTNGQRVAWVYDNDPDILESAELDDTGSPEQLASGDLVTRGVDSPATPGNWVYYGAWNSTLEFTAVDIRGTGSGESPVGAVVGNTWSPTVPVAGERAARVLVDDGGDLVSIDASEPEAGGFIDHGPIPSDLEGAVRVTYASSFAPTALVQMSRESATEEDDLVFVDTRDGASITRVTNDANTAPEPVDGF